EERITPMFDLVKSAYPHIFSREETIKLEPEVVSYVVAELQYVSILNSTADVKGEAYETLVGANLRGDRGEYFTPRNVCDMTVQMIMSLFDETKLTSLKVADCCCGTGGFLVSWMDNLRDLLCRQEARRGTKDIKSRVRERIKEICVRDLFGTEINPGLVRTAQMNLVVHGDGSTNVHQVNALKRPGEWSDHARAAIPYGGCDIVITNPPFGEEVKVDDAHVLSQYELAGWATENRRCVMPAEQLFMEAAMNFLKPGGVLGVVVPDGILNNPGLAFLRNWLVHRSRVIASIDLPKETFGRNKGVNNPSVLIARKFTRRQVRDAVNGIIDTSYEVFMCSPRTSGIDKRGNTMFLRHPNGEFITEKGGHRVPDDQISRVSRVFDAWRRGDGRAA
ncbi:MAG: N-6 DNA methylase, partial [Myxococcota bacterium]